MGKETEQLSLKSLKRELIIGLSFFRENYTPYNGDYYILGGKNYDEKTGNRTVIRWCSDAGR